MQIDVPVMETFLVFCRMAGCLILVPGLSTARVPTRFRLFLAVVLAFATAPLVDVSQRPNDASSAGLLWLVAGESVPRMANPLAMAGTGSSPSMLPDIPLNPM